MSEYNEPLSLKPVGDGLWLIDKDDLPVLFLCTAHCGVDSGIRERIVACVNAMAGVDDPAAHEMLRDAIVKTNKAAYEKIATLEQMVNTCDAAVERIAKQRDELQEARNLAAEQAKSLGDENATLTKQVNGYERQHNEDVMTMERLQKEANDAEGQRDALLEAAKLGKTAALGESHRFSQDGPQPSTYHYGLWEKWIKSIEAAIALCDNPQPKEPTHG